jgi:hypothetical protein
LAGVAMWIGAKTEQDDPRFISRLWAALFLLAGLASGIAAMAKG